ncbi:MAG: phosphatidate cytidylyltransferase [Pontiellaceae bacterium]
MDIKRISTGSIIALLIIILFLNIPAGHPIALLILLAICGLALWEFYTLLIAGGLSSSRKWGTAIGIIFCIATWLYMLNPASSNESILPSDTILWTIMVLVVISTFYRLLGYSDMRDGLNHGLGTLLGFIYVPFLFSFFVRLFLIDDISQPAWIAFYTVLSTKISDTGGYFIGSRFGRNKLATTISPKKSWEGLVGGILFCLILNILWLLISNGYIGSLRFSFLHALVLSLLFPLFGTAGDLVESLFKRAVKQKDSSSVAYGIGGLLDMIDSLLFTAPMFYIYLQFLLATGK